ncbi:MAG: hypothetical protein M3P23_02700 [Actinomycetota bacterium]|nr:hypothetical protein [Actinomycetota bacterium]
MIALLADAFGIAPEVSAVTAAPLRDPDATLSTWLLEGGGQAISTVLTCRVDDAITVWCMATPERFTRHL